MYKEFSMENKDKNIEFDNFINNKIQNDKKIVKSVSRKTKKKKNEIENNSNIKKEFIANLRNSIINSLKDKIAINDGNINNALNDIYEISEELENISIKYSKSFYMYLKDSIKFSNELQKRNFEKIIQKDFIENLDNLFIEEIELKKIKENEEIKKFADEYLEKIETKTIPDIEKLINNKNAVIESTKNSVCLKIYKLINNEIENSAEMIKNAEKEYGEKIKNLKNEINQTFDREEKIRLESILKSLKNETILEFAFKNLIGRMEIIISIEIEELRIHLESLENEISKIIEENKKYQELKLGQLKNKEKFLKLMKNNSSFFYNYISAIQSTLIAIFGSLMRGVVVGITSSIFIGGTIGTSFGLPGIGVGCLIGLMTGTISLLIHHFKRDDKYKNILVKITEAIIKTIEGNFTNIEDNLTNFKNNLINEMKLKVEIEKNKIKRINFDEFRNNYETEKQSIIEEIRKLF